MTSLAPLIAVPLAAAASAVLIVALKPTLKRYALARPNARSSHDVPTPQGGGIAIITATLLAAGTLLSIEGPPTSWEPPILALASIALAVVGAIDDIKPLRPTIRFIVQVLAVSAVVFTAGGRLFPAIPLPLERGLELFAGLWFVNLVNFTDGLDWMTVAGIVPLSVLLLCLGLAGLLPALPTLVAAALLGGLLGFAPFNKPVARLFMGDVGALPIGLLVAWLLYRLALEGGLPAALILPLYAVSDTTITLLWRLRRGEKFWRPHRSHFYQVATDNGFSVPEVVGLVFALNLVLAGLAGATLLWPTLPVTVAGLAAAGGLVGLLMWRFTVPRAGQGTGQDTGQGTGQGAGRA